jgi:putative transposase
MLTRKAFKYRLYPTPKQEQHLLFVLRRCRELYNSALEQRKAFYQMRRKSLGYSAQAAELADVKAAYPAYQDIYSQVDVLRRLDKAFAAFFRRIRTERSPAIPAIRDKGAMTASPTHNLALRWLRRVSRGTIGMAGFRSPRLAM